MTRNNDYAKGNLLDYFSPKNIFIASIYRDKQIQQFLKKLFLWEDLKNAVVQKDFLSLKNEQKTVLNFSLESLKVAG